MVRYLTRFHCGNWGSAGQKKNAPATHTRHDVFQLSSLHATHCVRKKMRKSTTQKFKADPGTCSYHHCSVWVGKTSEVLLAFSLQKVGNYSSIFLQKKKKKEISCSELLKMLMISVALQNILSFTMYGTSLKYSDLSEWIEITYILT